MIKENKVFHMDAITFLEQVYEEYGDESIDMFLVDFPYTFKGHRRVTANSWDLPVDTDAFFELAMKMLTKKGAIVLTANFRFGAYLVGKFGQHFKYEWVWEKDNGSNFTHVKFQPFKVHEFALVFGKSATSYTKNGKNMLYNPQYTEGKPYSVKRKGMTKNLAVSEGYERTSGNYEGKRYPRSVQKFNVERGLHETQKPLELFEYLIKTHTNPGGLVIDCCAGSGTTAIAAKNNTRRFIVNDNQKKHCEIIIKRLGV